MSSPTHYDSIVIGSGQGGTPLANALAGAGRKTALVERSHIGGCCVNEGCTPTKTMIASGRVAYLARRAAHYGVHHPVDAGSAGKDAAVRVDMSRVRQRKRDIVDSFRAGGEKRAAAAGVDVIVGRASFMDAKTVRVEKGEGSDGTGRSSSLSVSADSIFVNVGERPGRPKLDGLDDIPADRVLDSTSVMELGDVPSHLVVLGGGYIGLEFGQLFRRLGATVTIVQRGAQLLPREDPDIAACMLDILREDGITVHLSSTAVSVSASSSSSIDLKIHSKKAGGSSESTTTTATITGFSHLLLAAGRVPNTDDLDLAAAGIQTSDAAGHIAVDDKLETNVPGVYALGDVKGPPAFTHISYDDFRILRDNLGLDEDASTAPKPTKPRPRTVGDRQIPYVVYTDPQLGHVGLHESEARARFGPDAIKVASMPMSYVARALETDETRGMMKAVVEAAGGGRILGFTCLGLEGGELMAVVQTAMMGDVPWTRLRDAVWAHPSLAEALNNLWGFLK